MQGASSGISNTAERIIRLTRADGTVGNEVLYYVGGTSPVAPSTQYLAEMNAATTSTPARWNPMCASPGACTATDMASSAVDWSGTSSAASGASIARTNGANTNSKADWTKQTASTFGLPNP